MYLFPTTIDNYLFCLKPSDIFVFTVLEILIRNCPQCSSFNCIHFYINIKKYNIKTKHLIYPRISLLFGCLLFLAEHYQSGIRLSQRSTISQMPICLRGALSVRCPFVIEEHYQSAVHLSQMSTISQMSVFLRETLSSGVRLSQRSTISQVFVCLRGALSVRCPFVLHEHCQSGVRLSYRITISQVYAIVLEQPYQSGARQPWSIITKHMSVSLTYHYQWYQSHVR